MYVSFFFVLFCPTPSGWPVLVSLVRLLLLACVFLVARFLPFLSLALFYSVWLFCYRIWMPARFTILMLTFFSYCDRIIVRALSFSSACVCVYVRVVLWFLFCFFATRHRLFEFQFYAQMFFFLLSKRSISTFILILILLSIAPSLRTWLRTVRFLLLLVCLLVWRLTT